MTRLPRRVLFAAPLLPAVATAQTAPLLRIATGGAVTSLDPHFHNSAPNNAVALHVFDRLVDRDERARLQPGLAESWRALDETNWEFRLRPGVTWHDGKPFTADDVVFSFQRAPAVPNSPGGFGGFLRSIARIEAPEPLLLRITTRAPNPVLPNELAMVFIIARHAAEGLGTEDFNSTRAAIGTGPYAIAAYRPGERVELRRHAAHWTRPVWERVDYRFITQDAARVAALLAGDVDMIDQVPSSDAARLAANPRLTVSEIESLRVMYLNFDRSRAEAPPGFADADGGALAANPLNDVRVRRALSLALNREGLVRQVMDGAARPTGQWLPPGAFGHDPAIAAPAQDLDAARRLLAEAGFPRGFRMVLSSPTDRYPNDARTAQAVAQMWTRVGVRTEVQALPWSAFASRSARQEFGARLVGWGSPSGEASYLLINLLMTYSRERGTGANNVVRYSNPALDALTDRATATLDDAAREDLLRQATRMAMEDVAFLPMFQLVNQWALRRGLAHRPRMDEYTLAMGVSPAAG